MPDERAGGNLFTIIKYMKNWLWKLCMLILVLLSTIAFSWAQTITNSTTNFNDFSIKIQQALSAQDTRTTQAPLVVRQKIFQNFCDVMNTVGSSPQSIPRYANANTKIYYNPQQSVFMHIVCGPYGFISKFWLINENPEDPKTYFFKDDWVTLGIYGVTQDDIACRPDFSMTDCNIAKEFTDILHRILNDMFDIKQSQLYGWTSQADNPKNRFNDFTKKYFVGFEICPDKKCNYPKTQNRLSAYFKKAEWLLKKLDIINRSHINKELKDEEVICKYPWTDAYNLLVCGFGSKDASSLENFVAMIENEIFFYRLFMANYMWWIAAERRLLNEQDRWLNRAVERTAQIVAKTQQQIAWTQDAVDMSMRSLREMAATFPIHIGLLIYYEDLYRFRKELVKMVTPLYTLSDKLRNVQDANDQ
jgi:hypothetical protein